MEYKYSRDDNYEDYGVAYEPEKNSIKKTNKITILNLFVFCLYLT